jgi:hypothetical protein
MPRERFGSGVWEDEMVVIRHEDVRGDRPSEPSNGLAEKAEKGLAVAIGTEDRPLFIAAGGDVIESAWKLES